MTGSSGTFTYNPAISELLIEALERCQKPTTELTPAQIASGRRSLNLVLVSWANRGVNLWTVAQFISYMPRGVAQYFAPPQTVDVLADSVTLRQYQMGAPVSVAPAFTTILSSSTVTVAGLSATPGAGQYIGVNIPIGVGGIVIPAGFYQVTAVPGSGEATFNAGVAATSATTGGVVPQFVTTTQSATVTVNFPNHGLSVGQPFVVQQTVAVGGLTLLGPYPVAAVASSSQFTFVAPYPAGSGATVFENGGLASLSTQATAQNGSESAYPVDIQLYPLARGEYMQIPNKKTQGRITSYWIDRQIVPVFNVWPLPDQNGPYELKYRASQQVQDADIIGGQTLNMPYRFLAAFTADLSAALAIKWAPALAAGLATVAQTEWDRAADEDIEKTSLFLSPDVSSYFS